MSSLSVSCITSSSLETVDKKSSSESIPVTGVGGAASEGLGSDAVVDDVCSEAAAAAAEARSRLLGDLSVLVDDIFASAAFLFLVVGGILAVGMGDAGKGSRE